MSSDLKDITAEVLELPRIARAELASQLLESLDDLSEEENEHSLSGFGRARSDAGSISQARRIREAIVYFDERREGLGDRFEQDLTGNRPSTAEVPM